LLSGEREAKLVERRSNEVTLVKKCTPGFLGIYLCHHCSQPIATSVEGLERHLEAHENKKVTKIYRSSTGRLHPSEQYLSIAGKYVPDCRSKLCKFVVDNIEFKEGDTWQCAHCTFNIAWEEGFTGQKVTRIVERIETHLTDLDMHGECEEVREERKKKVAEKIEKPQELVQLD